MPSLFILFERCVDKIVTGLEILVLAPFMLLLGAAQIIGSITASKKK